MATTTTTKSSRKVYLTPNQLAELKKGPKANIVIGPDGDRFIGLEGASISLLTHFSPYARKKLIEERGTVLCIPNGCKKTLIWMYKYMQAGEHDPQGMETFEALTFNDLVLLFQHCTFLDYTSLMARTIGRLKGKYYDSLPTVDDIKLFAASIPPLYEFAVSCLSNEMVNPWTCNYAPYLQLATADPGFGEALGEAMQKHLAQRIKVGEEYYQYTTNRQVLCSKKYLDSALAKVHTTSPSTKTTKKTAKKTKRKKSKAAKPMAKSPEMAKKSKTATCFKCGGEGHIDRNCTAEETAAAASPTKLEKPTRRSKSRKPLTCFQCGGEGHIARNCTDTIPQEKTTEGADNSTTAQPTAGSKTLKVVKCFNCNEKGHIARHCTVKAPAVQPAETSNIINGEPRARNTTGRNKHFRRAQRDRIVGLVELAGNGEGLQTCDRGVRNGEMKRTGLVI